MFQDSPLNESQLVDHAQLGERHQPTPHQEGGDGRAKNGKDDDGAEVLEEIALKNKKKYTHEIT